MLGDFYIFIVGYFPQVFCFVFIPLTKVFYFGNEFYLAIFGSVITFLAFYYALTKVSPVQISILIYVNTIISILLSWLILNEEITFKFIMAAFLIILGVFIINYNKEMFKSQKVRNEKTGL